MGNFTKIVRLVPVKILFDPESLKGFESRIAPRMSVVVSVNQN
jgi:membrane fusion protein (multidrug efflux system)